MNSSALSVDCDLSPVAMAKLGQEPHLSTLIGRTSDLEHSPGLVVQLHPKVYAVRVGWGVLVFCQWTTV